MKYKISFNNGKDILIQDIIGPDERLSYSTQGRRYGENISVTMSLKEFLGNIRRAMLSFKTIISYTLTDDLKIGWVEYGDRTYTIHKDTFEFDFEDQVIIKEALAKYENEFYTRVVSATAERVANRVFCWAPSNSLDKKCINHIYRYSRNSSVADNITHREAFDLAVRLIENEEVFRHSVMKSPNNRIGGYEFSSKILLLCSCIITLTTGISTFAFSSIIMKSIIAILFLFSLVVDGLSLNVMVYARDSWKKEMFDDFVKAFFKKNDISLEEVSEFIRSKNTDEKIEGIVDFVHEDIVTAYYMGTETRKFINDLHGISDDYSHERHEELVGGGTPADRVKYLLKLSRIEESIFSANGRIGRIKREEMRLTSDDLFKRLKYLGWSKSRISYNTFLDDILCAVRAIEKDPYEGCEVDIASLIGIAVRYVSAFDDPDFGDNVQNSSTLIDLTNAKKDIFLAISHKHDDSKKFEEMVSRYAKELEEKKNAVTKVQEPEKGKRITLEKKEGDV